MKTWGTGGTFPHILKLACFTFRESYNWRLSNAEYMISRDLLRRNPIPLSTRGVHLVIRMLGKILFVVGNKDVP